MKNIHGNATHAQMGTACIDNNGPHASVTLSGAHSALTCERMFIGEPDRPGTRVTGRAVQATLPPTQKPTTDDPGLARVKMDHKVFEVLCSKKRRGETVRMALERIILAD